MQFGLVLKQSRRFQCNRTEPNRTFLKRPGAFYVLIIITFAQIYWSMKILGACTQYTPTIYHVVVTVTLLCGSDRQPIRRCTCWLDFIQTSLCDSGQVKIMRHVRCLYYWKTKPNRGFMRCFCLHVSVILMKSIGSGSSHSTSEDHSHDPAQALSVWAGRWKRPCDSPPFHFFSLSLPER